MEIKPFVLSQFGIPNEFGSFSKQVCISIDGLWFNEPDYINSEYKVFIGGCEPYDFTDRCYSQDEVIKNKDKFDLILTSNDKIVESCSNAILFPFGTRRISKNFKKENTFFEVSFLCGLKSELEGHLLRHEVYSKINKVKNMGVKALLSTFNRDEEYFGLNGKDYIFNTSQYSIIIENSRHRNYFTEKIIDSFMSRTIPLYWGCTNIGDFFDTRGIIKFEDADDLFRKISALTPDIYHSKKEILDINFEKAKQYEDFFSRVNNIIKEKLI